MIIADTHCDALWKMLHAPAPSFQDANLAVNANTLKQGNVSIQHFALYTSVDEPKAVQRQNIMKQLDYFHQHITTNPQIKWQPAQPLTVSNMYTNAILSLEGAGMFADQLSEWENLKKQGVQIASLTWNEKNDLAAGSGASNSYGLTKAGETVIDWQNNNGMITDLSHLNEQSFWDVIERADRVIVSHANVKALYHHPRNISDEQINSLKQKNSFIGLTFYPPFINGTKSAAYTDLAKQIDYLCSLGAEHMIGFGSDFDGIDYSLSGLNTPADYPRLLEWLLRHFPEHVVKGVAGQNFQRYWKENSQA
ncbi:dipeptidase. Metallo peptidase. MEROPS family M19 [Alteribacillus persepolensis]|uniref:Dipeptidase. Metallo peptidase. MEROPS family M19 n=1 Tax=Alteribacillus persepolensis TaxID=568899 RepID=A0A1G7Z002_9BACI|nr:membrane dipeptidase [Alteribacillus persepolensis]SDH01925.1 dipeptidase. Metallo peptidase. MEROPS family M19 [Alteribacillus persepolensis]